MQATKVIKTMCAIAKYMTAKQKYVPFEDCSLHPDERWRLSVNQIWWRCPPSMKQFPANQPNVKRFGTEGQFWTPEPICWPHCVLCQSWQLAGSGEPRNEVAKCIQKPRLPFRFHAIFVLLVMLELKPFFLSEMSFFCKMHSGSSCKKIFSLSFGNSIITLVVRPSSRPSIILILGEDREVGYSPARS